MIDIYSKKKINAFKDKTTYSYCYYKNDKNEILLADLCLIISNHILVTPKGALSQCYIHNSQIVKLSEHRMPKYTPKYYLNHEDIKKYEDNFKHIPKTKINNPLSNPGFSIGQHDKLNKKDHQGSKIVFQDLTEEDSAEEIRMWDFMSRTLYGYNTEILIFAFKGIKKNFPKCN